jgi:hypothetical protein
MSTASSVDVLAGRDDPIDINRDEWLTVNARLNTHDVWVLRVARCPDDLTDNPDGSARLLGGCLGDVEEVNFIAGLESVHRFDLRFEVWIVFPYTFIIAASAAQVNRRSGNFSEFYSVPTAQV